MDKKLITDCIFERLFFEKINSDFFLENEKKRSHEENYQSFEKLRLISSIRYPWLPIITI